MFAKMKLHSHEFESDRYARLAALDIRVLIEFDPIRANSRDMQAKLVQSYMRCVFNIPASREFVWSGYPSEPVLSEAAAQLLNSTDQTKGILHRAPEILEDAFKSGFLAKGERGEIVARTLLTVAHDLAVLKNSKPLYGPRFHRPIRLLDFLKNLVSYELWEKIQNAKPYYAYPEDPTLKVAFANTWMNFSHFVHLGDHESFNLKYASALLKRGAAMQTYNNQRNQDIGVPLHHGDPARTEISIERTSIFQAQIKNAAIPPRVFPDPNTIGKCNEGLPTLSVVMQLGTEKQEPVKILTTSKGGDNPSGDTRSASYSRSTDVERRHYCIVLYGCTSNTYSCIGVNDGSKYQQLLRVTDPLDDFPRKTKETLLNSLRSMNARLYSDERAYINWDDE
jgi:hypothetical protein